MGFGYAMNQMLGGEYASVRTKRLLQALADCLNTPAAP
jgi:hypothetical protein